MCERAGLATHSQEPETWEQAPSPIDCGSKAVRASVYLSDKREQYQLCLPHRSMAGNPRERASEDLEGFTSKAT